MVLMNVKNIFCNVEENKINSQKKIILKHVQYGNNTQPYFESYDYIMVDGIDNSAYLFDHGVCLPSGSDMTDEQQTRVIEIIKSL